MRYSLRSAGALLLTSLLTFHQLVLPVAAFADDATPSSQAVEQAASPSPTPTPTPTLAPSTTTVTGNASAQGESHIDVNPTTTTTEGSISATGCSVTGTLTCPVVMSNSATVEQTNEATARSGQNTLTNAPGEAVVQTGTASGSATTLNVLNTTSIVASDAAVLSASASAEASASGVIALQNDAVLSSITESAGVSGGNLVRDSSGNATIQTGTSTATVSVANLLNTTAIGSTMQFLVINIDQDQTGLINLLDFWRQLQEVGNTSVATAGAELNVGVENTASSSAVAHATAISGDNVGSDNGGKATIVTGDAFASANVFNLINTNLIGSQFLFAVINIFHTFTGDIVVPNATRFGGDLPLAGGIDPSAMSVVAPTSTLQNNVISSGNLAAQADSGTNTEQGSGGSETIVTGDAYAHAVQTGLYNTTISGQNWLQVLLNNFGLWNGGVTGWSAPDEVGTVAARASTQLSMSNPNAERALAPSSEMTSVPTGTLTLQNTATSSYDVGALARSGGNQAVGNGMGASLTTGASVALANVFEMINTNVLGSKFFFPIINVFSQWNGNLAVAYPDLRVTLSGSVSEVHPGDQISYTVSYLNSGYEEAREARVSIDLPEGVTYVGNSNSLVPERSGHTYTFPVGRVKSGASGSFTITAQVSSSLSAESGMPSLLSSLRAALIPPAFAADTQTEYMVTARIETPDVEQDTQHNTASVMTKVILPQTTTADTSTADAAGAPYLQVTSTHNVHTFVYPKDTITFTVVASNTGNTSAKDMHLQQLIMNEAGQTLARVQIPMGPLAPGATRKLSFGLKVPSVLVPAQYTSVISLVGVSDADGASVASNTASTSFRVRALQQAFVPEPVFAAAESVLPEAQSGKVLGAMTEAVAQPHPAPQDVKPYLLVLSLVVLVVIGTAKRRSAMFRMRETACAAGQT